MTQVVNELVNGAGMTYFHRLSGETGVDAGRDHPCELRGTRDLRLTKGMEEIAYDNKIDAAVQTRMRLEVRTRPSGPRGGW